MIEFHKLLQEEDRVTEIGNYESPRIPRQQWCKLLTLAQPPKSPASPNRFLGAVLLAIGLFPTVGGFLMLKSSRYSV